MQTRIRKIANFFAFNILFFGLYLNFIDKDKELMIDKDQQQTAAFGASILPNTLNNAIAVPQTK